jgi:hypothetical protein
MWHFSPSQKFSLIRHESPVLSRLTEDAFGFVVFGLVRQPVAFPGLGAEIVCPIHGISIPGTSTRTFKTKLGHAYIQFRTEASELGQYQMKEAAN